MGRYILKRVGQSVLILFCVSVIVFVFVNMAPGDPYTQRLDPSVSAEVREEMLTKMGYYDPIHVKFLKWIGGALQGDFGYSTKYKKPVWDVICERLPNTILMGVSALVLSTAIAIPAGKLSATRRNSIFDYGATILSFIGISIPAFFFGLMLIKFLAFDLKLFPISGMVTVGAGYTGWAFVRDVAWHLVLPTIVLALLQTATLMRYTRSAMLTETIFVWPGIGRLSYTAILDRDYPLIMALLLLTTVIILACNLVADILYALVDPRIRYE